MPSGKKKRHRKICPLTEIDYGIMSGHGCPGKFRHPVKAYTAMWEIQFMMNGDRRDESQMYDRMTGQH